MPTSPILIAGVAATMAAIFPLVDRVRERHNRDMERAELEALMPQLDVAEHNRILQQHWDSHAPTPWEMCWLVAFLPLAIYLGGFMPATYGLVALIGAGVIAWDMRRQWVPPALILLFLLASMAMVPRDVSMTHALTQAAAVACTLWSIKTVGFAITKREWMGEQDYMLAAACSFWLYPLEIAYWLIGAGCVALAMISLQAKGRIFSGGSTPFAPALILSVCLCVVFR